MLERRLAESGERVGEAVLNVGLRVEAALTGRRIASPGRPKPSPAVKGFDDLAGSLGHGPGAAKRGRRRAGDERERGCGSPPTVRAGANQERVPQRELRSPTRTQNNHRTEAATFPYVKGKSAPEWKKPNTRNGLRVMRAYGQLCRETRGPTCLG